MEALLRWRHPRRGVVGPDEFIQAVERSGLIVGLGHYFARPAAAAEIEGLLRLGRIARGRPLPAAVAR